MYVDSSPGLWDDSFWIDAELTPRGKGSYKSHANHGQRELRPHVLRFSGGVDLGDEHLDALGEGEAGGGGAVWVGRAHVLDRDRVAERERPRGGLGLTRPRRPVEVVDVVVEVG